LGGLSGEGEDLLKGRPLFLLGFMGAGKTTVGSLLARTLGCSFVDLDALIVERVGKSIVDIFETEGEESFRRYETEALESVAEGAMVVATGGGVVTRGENWKVLDKGITVALMASPEVLMRRLGRGEGRPLLHDEKDWRELLNERESLYRRAQLVIDTTCLTPEEVVDCILGALEEGF